MKIAIVEDNLEIQQLIRQTLEEDGFECQATDNGAIALNLVQTMQSDLIILAIVLVAIASPRFLILPCARIAQLCAQLFKNIALSQSRRSVFRLSDRHLLVVQSP